tara:strand:- start:1099 stop:1485 length:387 start_codon:yes stop_codon:yes gene_type:complete
MYAIINISGKQFKAMEGARFRIPRQKGDNGTKLTFDNVLLINNGDDTQIGTPNLSGVSVSATIINQGREKKILVYKKKRRKGYQRKNGHRQLFTEVEIEGIKLSTKKSKQTNVKKEVKVVKEATQEEE